MIRKTLLTTLSVSAVTLLVAIASSSTTHASIANFEPGRIIDDQVMRNSDSMTTSQIQSFLNSKVRSCDSNGDKMYNSSQTRKQYAASRGVSTPFKCLKDYTQGGKSAAQIIKEKSKKYDINPQVLIVLMQKEQGLITDDWPWPVQYRTATGYGCPDTAPCASQYYGLANQLDWAAKMFDSILKRSPGWYSPYVAGNNSRVYWHPDLSRCGSQSLNIENWSTAAFYSYTPYRPNQAALNAGYGTGNSCSSYGNRNFYLYFTDWFGSTRHNLNIKSMSVPRYMRLTTDIAKTNFRTGSSDGVVLSRGMEIYFDDRYTYNGELYLRTQSDTRKSLERGIKFIDLLESLGMESMSVPRTMVIKEDVRKTNFRTGEGDGVVLDGGMEVFFTGRHTHNGELYLRTEADTNKSLERGIRYTDLEEIQEEPLIEIGPMTVPRELTLKSSIRKTNFRTGEGDGVVLDKGMKIYFDERYTYEDELYLRTEADTNKSLERGIRYADLEE